MVKPLATSGALLSVLLITSACGSGGTEPTRPNDNDVIQGACGFTARRGDTSLSTSSAGGMLTVSVRTGTSGGTGCTWPVSVNDDATSFVNLVEPSEGRSSALTATVSFNVSGNTGGPRTGHVVVAGVTYTITQDAAPCRFALSGDTRFTATGGNGTATITQVQGGSCSWRASTEAPFITNLTPVTGTGSGTVTFTVAANTSPDGRTATITVNSDTLTITQAGTFVPCVLTVSPTAFDLQQFTDLERTISVVQTQGQNCPWTAVSNSDFLFIRSNSVPVCGRGCSISGTGTGVVNFNPNQNNGPARSGTLTVAGQTITVNQAGVTVGPTCTFITFPSPTFPADGGVFTVGVSASSCLFSVSSNVPWATVSVRTFYDGIQGVMQPNPGGTRGGVFTLTALPPSSGQATISFTQLGR
jgi:hypothetical protein